MSIAIENTQKKIVFLPALLGTIVEYYDYALYGFNAAILSKYFFPSDNITISLLKTFGIFIAGSLSKPLGALIFGYLGDKYGRSIVLKITMIGIAIPTTIIGLLPSYNTIGLFAPILLLLCRILQGFFISGEYDGVRIFIFEYSGDKYQYLANSLINMASMLGIYFASIVVAISSLDLFPNWMWRVPFIVSGFLGVLVFIARAYLQETPEFIINKEYTKNTKPINYQYILLSILLCGTVGGCYHFYFIFFSTYLNTILKIQELTISRFYISQAILVYTLCTPLSGWISDQYGPKTSLKLAFYILVATIIYTAFTLFQNIAPSLWIMLVTAACLAFLHTPGMVILLKNFPITTRYRYLSFSHSIGSMLFSGSAPIISLWLWHNTSITIMPLLYFLLLSIISYIALTATDLIVKNNP